MMLKPALRPPLRAPMRGATTLREGGGVWTPAALGSKLLAWWNADRADLITLSGNQVTSWRDAVAGYDLAQAVAGARPIYSATGFNGFPAITFVVAEADELTLAPSPLPSGAVPCEVWSVAQQNALVGDTASRAFISWGNTTAGRRRQVGRAVTGGLIHARAIGGTGAANVTLDGTNVTLNSRHVIRTRFAAELLSMWVDGISEGAVAMALGGTATDRVRVGSSPGAAASNSWDGPGREILVTDLTLTPGEVAALDAYTLSRRAL